MAEYLNNQLHAMLDCANQHITDVERHEGSNDPVMGGGGRREMEQCRMLRAAYNSTYPIIRAAGDMHALLQDIATTGDISRVTALLASIQAVSVERRTNGDGENRAG